MQLATENQLNRLSEITGLDWRPMADQITRGQASGLVALHSLVNKGRASLEAFAGAVRKFIPDYERPSEPTTEPAPADPT